MWYGGQAAAVYLERKRICSMVDVRTYVCTDNTKYTLHASVGLTQAHPNRIIDLHVPPISSLSKTVAPYLPLLLHYTST